LAAEEVRRGELHLDHSIVVADDRGQVIATVMFRDCVLIKG
jgi:predicted N-acetyltransferase YhbS